MRPILTCFICIKNKFPQAHRHTVFEGACRRYPNAANLSNLKNMRANERPIRSLKSARSGCLRTCDNRRAHLYPALHPPCKPFPQIKSAARLYRRSQKTHIEWTRMGRLAHRLTTYCNFARINRRQTYPARNRDGNKRTSKRRRRCIQRKTKNFPFFTPLPTVYAYLPLRDKTPIKVENNR